MPYETWPKYLAPLESRARGSHTTNESRARGQSRYSRVQGLDSADAYFIARPDEHRALFRWMETAAPRSFEQVVTTQAREVLGGFPHRSVFHVAGARRGRAAFLGSLA